MSLIMQRCNKKRFRFYLFRPFYQLLNLWRLANDYLCISRSGLFSSEWYLKQYKDIADAGINPLIHYIRHGAGEGRDPNPLFNSKWYLRWNPEIAKLGENPLVHYIQHGIVEHLKPSAYFDSDWYASEHEDVAKTEMHPLVHYLKVGASEGRMPSPIVSSFQRWRNTTGNRKVAKILIIDRIYPRPDQDSGSVDCINYIRIFQEFGYQVFFASDEEYRIEPAVYEWLDDSGVICLNPIDFLTIESFIESEIDDFSAVVLSRVSSGGRFYELIRKRSPHTKLIFNTVDLHGIREGREAKILNDPFMIKRARSTLEREFFLADKCDATIVVSEYEMQRLKADNPAGRVVHIPLMRDCPGSARDFIDRHGICFIGNYLHKPNIDALIYFLNDVWPAILNKLPSCKFYIIGPELPDAFIERKDPNVELIGYVQDLTFYLDRMRLSVAPLRYGAGSKGKVVTSLAHGLPCVASYIAIEGMGLLKDRHIVVENNPEAFADCVVRLYEDQAAWMKLSDEGWRFCARHFSFGKGRENMAELFKMLELPIFRSGTASR